jgi:type I restriction enzyme S subunit
MEEIKNTKTFYNTEIPSDWEIITLGEVVTEMKSGLSRELSNEDIGLPVIRSNNLINNTVDYSDIKYWYKIDNQGANTENYFLAEGDILVNFINSISQIGKCAFFKDDLKRPVIFTTNLMVVRFNNSRIDSRFYLYYTLINHYQKFVDSITKPAINQASFTTKDYKKLQIPLPPLPEQKAIAQVLSTADAAIHTTEKLITQKELRKKWFMQQLLTGKLRLKGFSGEWKQKKLGKVFNQIKNINDGGESHSVMTISSKRGLISQEDKFDRVIAGDSLKKYTQLIKGDFAYNKGNSKTYPMGCIYTLENKESAVVPFVYICFSPSDLVDGLFYKHWFLAHGLDRQLNKIITSGARGDGLLNVNTDDFFGLKIIFPPKEEQTAIAQVLQAADKEIGLLKAKAEKLREQKKGLMQQLLTGKVRLKID